MKSLLRAVKNPNLIFDVGAHQGEDSLFYLQKGFDVVAVEANPSLVSSIQKRLRTFIQNGRLKLVEGAIAEQNQSVAFFVNDSLSVWGTTCPDWAQRNEVFNTASHKIDVQGVPFGDIIQENGMPHYIKIDIEGADLLCLESLLDFDTQPNFISIESEKKSWEKLLYEFELLQKLGYNRFKVVSQKHIQDQSCPPQTKEGLNINFRFEEGSSGLFGHDLPGPWLDYTEAIHVYKKIFRVYQWFGDESFINKIPKLRNVFSASWYDTHATRI